LLLKDLERPILYSTMCRAAYDINSQFYGGLHYMWCTPYFGSAVNSLHYTVPPSSSPLGIYRQLRGEIDGSDQHGEKIPRLRLGIRKGAMAMAKRGRITEASMQEIKAISWKLDRQHFGPLICVIPRIDALRYSRRPGVDERANPLSLEYILEDVPHSAFDVITIG